jgi:hypothetical protein
MVAADVRRLIIFDMRGMQDCGGFVNRKYSQSLVTSAVAEDGIQASPRLFKTCTVERDLFSV